MSRRSWVWRQGSGWALALVLLCAAVLPAGRATAADEAGTKPKLSEAQKQEIRDRYDRATKLYYLRKYHEAIAEYEAIYLISADPVMLYNIAQSYRNADQPETAAQFYKNYLRNAPTAANRPDVEKKIAEMDKLVEERRAAGVPTPGPPPLAVPPVTAPAPAPAPLPDVPVRPAPPPVASAPMPEMTTTPPGAPAPAPIEPARPPSHALRWTMLVAGGVFLTTSVVLGSAAGAKAREVERAAATRTMTFDDGLQKAEKDGRAASALAVGSGLLGMVALGAGVYLWATESSREGRDLREREARTTVVPVAGAGFAGALLHTTF